MSDEEPQQPGDRRKITLRQLIVAMALCAVVAAYVAVVQTPLRTSELGMFRLLLIHVGLGLVGFLGCDAAGRLYGRRGATLISIALGTVGGLLIGGSIISFVVMWFSPSA